MKLWACRAKVIELHDDGVVVDIAFSASMGHCFLGIRPLLDFLISSVGSFLFLLVVLSSVLIIWAGL